MPRGDGRPAVIVDPFSSGGLYAPAFAEAGIPAVAVMSRPDVLASCLDLYRPEFFDQVISFDPDEARVTRHVRRLRPRCILPGAATGEELADRLAARILPELANDAATGPARRHKHVMAQAARQAGLPVLRQVCTADPGEVARWIERAGLSGRDLVVKPPQSVGTDGVTRIPAGQDWREAFESQLGRLNKWDVRNDEMIVAEQAAGTEYVVDVFSHDGIHTVNDVCQYTTADDGAHPAVREAMEWLPPDHPAVPPLADYARRVLDAAGFRFGAAHVDLIDTCGGPRLIELNARPHGGGQPTFCRAATGDSQLHRAARYVAGVRDLPLSYTLLRPTLVVFLLSRGPGVVRNADVLASIPRLPSHIFSRIGLRNGQRLELTGDLLGSLGPGFVVLSHRSRDQIMADYAAIREIEASLIIKDSLIVEARRPTTPARARWGLARGTSA